jgi:hypothetical protein
MQQVLEVELTGNTADQELRVKKAQSLLKGYESTPTGET